ncbi:MAG: hypothetical protein M0P30_14550 [Syntrophorhabdaceae bacterium]|nr:hypothetical protein [Syntrophorhabdaceae bacterium]
MNQTIQDEFYRVAFRKRLYRTLDEIQADLDTFMSWYNNERTNQGCYCRGRTPMQTFTDDLPLYQQYVYEGVDETMAI